MLIVLLGTTLPAKSQNPLFKSLSQNYDLNAELYFYASTLRMINIARDPSFDDLVRDVEKMTFYQMDDITSSDMRKFIQQLITEDDFEEMITLESKEQTLYVVGKEEEEFIALMKTDGAVMAIDLQGMIRVDKIPELINSLNADSFLNVFEVGKDERQEHASDSKNN